MAKPQSIQLARGEAIPILFEDRSVMALDKPAGWMLVPSHWDRTARNLQLALDSSIGARDFWAKSRNLRFLRFVHRLDAETTGVLLMAKSAGGVQVYSKLFESRQMAKTYLAVVEGIPRQPEWTVSAPLGPDARAPGRMRVDEKGGKEAQTAFKVLEQLEGIALLTASPLTGRTHQIRVHLAHSGLPVVGDRIYGKGAAKTGQGRNDSKDFPLGLRAVSLEYRDPFTKRKVRIEGDVRAFRRAFGFSAEKTRLTEADRTDQIEVLLRSDRAEPKRTAQAQEAPRTQEATCIEA